MLRTKSGLPKHCGWNVDRHGKRRVRFRMAGFTTYLTGTPWSDDFMRQYAAARDGVKAQHDNIGAELRTKPGVFVPRDSSEFLAEQAVRRLRGRKKPVHVDLATGGGTIALAVADEVPKAQVWGTDVAADAVKLARKNAKMLDLTATFKRGDLFGALPRSLRGTVDVITLHPPYVPRDEIEGLPDEIRDWEPEHTLTDRSIDGMGLIHRTVDESPAWLRKGGWLLMEVSPDRAKGVKKVFRHGGFDDVESTKGGELKVTRVIVGRRPR